MLAQEICLELEPYVAKAISGLAAELRLVDIADYIAYLRMERYGCVADIGQMIDFAAFTNLGVLDLNKIADTHIFG